VDLPFNPPDDLFDRLCKLLGSRGYADPAPRIPSFAVSSRAISPGAKPAGNAAGAVTALGPPQGQGEHERSWPTGGTPTVARSGLTDGT